MPPVNSERVFGSSFYYFCPVKFFLRIVDLLLYTSVLTACCAAALCMATERLVSGGLSPVVNPLQFLVFGSSLVVYNTPRIVKKQALSRQQYRLWYFVFLGLGAVLALGAMWLLPLRVNITAAVLSVFAFAYFLPLLPFRRKRIRDIGWLKIAVLAGVWTTATTILPILYLHRSIPDYPFEILLRFVFIFTLCVVFDIRDMRTDLGNNIVTLPNRVGLRNSYRLINVSLVLFAALSVVQYLRYPQSARLAGALLTAVITWFIVGYIRRQPSDRAYLLLADGVMVLYALLVVWI